MALNKFIIFVVAALLVSVLALDSNYAEMPNWPNDGDEGASEKLETPPKNFKELFIKSIESHEVAEESKIATEPLEKTMSFEKLNRSPEITKDFYKTSKIPIKMSVQSPEFFNESPEKINKSLGETNYESPKEILTESLQNSFEFPQKSKIPISRSKRSLQTAQKGARPKDLSIKSSWKQYTTSLGSPEKTEEFFKTSNIPLTNSGGSGGKRTSSSQQRSRSSSPLGERSRDPSVESTWKQYTTSLGSPEKTEEFFKISKAPLKKSGEPGGIIKNSFERPRSKSPSIERQRDPSIESSWKQYTTPLGSPDRKKEYLKNSNIPLKKFGETAGNLGNPSSRPNSPSRSPLATRKSRSDEPTWKTFLTSAGATKSKKSEENSKKPVKKSKEKPLKKSDNKAHIGKTLSKPSKLKKIHDSLRKHFRNKQSSRKVSKSKNSRRKDSRRRRHR